MTEPCGTCPECIGPPNMWNDRPTECDRVVGERLKDSMADTLALLSEPDTPMRAMPWRERPNWRKRGAPKPRAPWWRRLLCAA